MGKHNMHFMCKLCKTGSLKLGFKRITTVRSHSKPSKEVAAPTKHQKAEQINTGLQINIS